jgi:hypothetical protein
MSSHFIAVVSLSAFGIIILAVMIWAAFFWRERLWIRSVLLALLIMSLLGNPFVYFYGAGTSLLIFFCEFVLFPLALCFSVYRGRRFLVPDFFKLVLAILIVFSIHIPVLHGDDYSVMWQIGSGTRWESALSFLPLGILHGSVVVQGLASNLYYVAVALSSLIVYGLLCYILAAVIAVPLKRLRKNLP